MNLRTILLLGAAAGAAGLTAMFAQGWLSSQRAALETELASAPQEETPAVLILVADEDLATGTFVQPSHLTWQAWPEDGVSREYVVMGQGSEKDFEGAVVRYPMIQGQPITSARLVHPGERGFLAAVQEPGKRAVSVPIDATTGIAGFVFPGDLVDVMLTIRMTVTEEEEEQAPVPMAGMMPFMGASAPTGETRYFSETLLEEVRVLAIDQAIENEDGTVRVAKTATLEVTPKQAERIAIALEMGTLSLSLRSLARDDEDADGTDKSKAAAKLAKKKPARSYTLDADVLYMVGDPRGLPNFGNSSRRINVLRGSEAGSTKY